TSKCSRPSHERCKANLSELTDSGRIAEAYFRPLLSSGFQSVPNSPSHRGRMHTTVTAMPAVNIVVTPIVLGPTPTGPADLDLRGYSVHRYSDRSREAP